MTRLRGDLGDPGAHRPGADDADRDCRGQLHQCLPAFDKPNVR
jgi:hypothetical protein